MNKMVYKRRDFIRLSVLGILGGGVSSCLRTNPSSRFIFQSPRGLLPKDIIRNLPSPWIFKEIEQRNISNYPLQNSVSRNIDLLAMNVKSATLTQLKSSLGFVEVR